MEVYGIKISEEAIAACIERMHQGTVNPFTKGDIEEIMAEWGVPRRHQHFSAWMPADRAADRLIQANRVCGSIKLTGKYRGKAPTWQWTS